MSNREALGDLALFTAKLREIRLALMTKPSIRPAIGSVYATRNGSVVACIANDSDEKQVVCVVLVGGHGSHNMRGREPGQAYELTNEGAYAMSHRERSGDVMEMMRRSMMSLTGGGEEWKQPKRVEKPLTELSDDELALRGMDVVVRLLEPTELIALARGRA